MPYTPKGCGKLAAAVMTDRYEAAIRLEQINQNMREATRYGLPITPAHRNELLAAEAAYDAATAALR